MAQHTVQFRPLDLNDTISEAAQLVMNNAPALLGAMLLANLPLLIWQGLVLAQPEQWTMPLRYTSLRDIDSVASVVLRTLDRFDVRLLAGVAIAAVVGLLPCSCTMRCAGARKGALRCCEAAPRPFSARSANASLARAQICIPISNVPA